MPLDALPPHLQTWEAWKGTDKDQSWFYTHIGRYFLGWGAFGPRSHHFWAKWRELPTTIFAWFGPGESRWELSEGEMAIRGLNKPVFYYTPYPFYLTRVQYWCDWHVQIQWPLFVGFHVKTGRRKANVWQGYIGFKRDGDRVYWLALYLGRGWK